MAAISVKRRSLLSPFKTLFPSQFLYHNFVEVGNKPRTRNNKDSVIESGEIDITKWKKMDSRALGITRTMIPSSPYTLLKILRSEGFEGYLVGGCVRDLLLNRKPKDFDVITTANLSQIKKQFHRCVIVGRRFPICRVHIKGSVIEVSSFKTLAKHSENKEKFLVSKIPKGCDKSDVNLWKNSMHRDFTVNSLFFDPINYKIYDYNNGMKDLLDLKLRTLVPAHLSFTEDCARILRGLRIAARLGLSFSKDIETAIHKQSSSLLNLSTSRIMMEIDYMLSFGAAESSLSLLHRFHILEMLLPFQAAYISRHATGSEQRTMMLMKLFSNMDNIVSCDQPSTCSLWLGILAFHQALVNKPQHPFVFLTFASVLYHQSWKDGLKFARKYSQPLISFEPESLDIYKFISDDEVARKVNKLALLVIDSLDVLVSTDSLLKTMSRFPGFPCSGLVFVSKKSADSAAKLFDVLSHEVETYKKVRTSFEMNHQLLGKGDISETRFALGKIILNTMGCLVEQNDENQPTPPSNTEFTHLIPSDLRLQQPIDHDLMCQKLNPNLSSSKKQNADTTTETEDIEDVYFLEQETLREIVSCPKMEDCTVEKPEEIIESQSPTQKSNDSKRQKLNSKLSNSNKRIAAPEKKIKDIEDGSLHEPEERKIVSKQHVEVLGISSGPRIEDHTTKKPKETNASQSSMQELICTLKSITETANFPSQIEAQNPKEKLNVAAEEQADQSITKEQSVNRRHKSKQVLPLSTLFK